MSFNVNDLILSTFVVTKTTTDYASKARLAASAHSLSWEKKGSQYFCAWVLVEAVEYQLNNTPRKCLGYFTPEEAMALESGRLAMKRTAWYEQATEWMQSHPL